VFDESFFVAVAFIILTLFTYRKFGGVIASKLDEKAAMVEKKLADALRAREEAQVMLSEYEKKYRTIEKEAEDILANANRKVQIMQSEAEEELKLAIAQRLKSANEKIKRAEELAIQDVQRQVVDIALLAAREIVKEKMSDETDDQLIKIAINDVSKVVH
jgi:F-type H+-transporting ATPase subunit b